jgi:hypothetical protein
VPVELVALSLKSVAPIRVTYNEGIGESFFDVYVELPAPSPGEMTIEGCCSSFIYDYLVPTVNLVFSNTDNPAQTYPLLIPGPGYPGLLEFVGLGSYEWETTTEKDHPPCDHDGFYATGEGPLPLDIFYGGGICGQLLWSPPQPVDPEFALISPEDWEAALGDERVQPMTLSG